VCLVELVALDTEPPGEAELTEIADGWRPYRTWVATLLRASG
jgi:3-methyladenine DNA glycosylase/8-oxoguanine DNA glycosylase